MAPQKRVYKKKLRRSVVNLSQRRTFIVLCEGKATEPNYLYALQQLSEIRRSVSVAIKVNKSRSGAAPLALVDAAIQVKGESKDLDEVWCVFDVEAPNIHPDLKEAVEKAEKHEIKVAISNPCFELWLILHYRMCHGYLSSKEACKQRSNLDGSAGKEVDGKKYMPKRKTAVKNARVLNDTHISNKRSLPHNNPSSGMYHLLEAIESHVRQAEEK